MGVHSNGFIGKHVTSSGYRNATSSSGTGVSDCTEALKRDPKCLINVHYALGPNRSHLRGGDGRRRPQRKPQEIGNAANHCMPPTIPMPSMYVRAEESVRCRGPSTSMQTDDVRFRTSATTAVLRALFNPQRSGLKSGESDSLNTRSIS